MPTPGVRPLIAGNWKMNGLQRAVAEIEAFVADADDALFHAADILICPPATLVSAAMQAIGTKPVQVGAQDCHPQASGAHTGDLSAEMFADLGASAVIVGHSERRSDHGETSALVQQKARAAHRAGLCAVICVGESEAERLQGRTLAVVSEQVAESLPSGAEAADTVIAYEPVWAIGTGLTPTPEDVAEVHLAIRTLLKERLGAEGETMRILYGGSVKPGNAAELLAIANVDGALVGGASLKAADFLGIARAAPAEA
ncbi:MAG: triose-phosphate isomerase [Hyphomicrobiaceae bacterium]|nr:triose-phosphate isomerase [Hyphomicrobiaceae bacterium]